MGMFWRRLSINVLIFTFAISLSITLTVFISPILYHFLSEWMGIGGLVGLTHEQVNNSFLEVIQFLIIPLREFTLSFFNSSQSGVQHFVEVKHLIWINHLVLLITTLGLGYVLVSRKKRWRNALPDFQVLLSFPFFLLIFIIIAFDQVFVLFHRILFRNDLWLFNPLEDPIIYILPQELFMALFIVAIILYWLIIYILKWFFEFKR